MIENDITCDVNKPHVTALFLTNKRVRYQEEQLRGRVTERLSKLFSPQ